MSTASRGRTRASIRSSALCVTILFAAAAAIDVAAQSAGRGAPRPAAASSQPSAPLPQVVAAAIRVVGLGLGANGSELRPFNESPGTVVALAVQAPRGSGIVEIDTRASKIDAFSDDKGQSLLEEGRIGSFPKVSEDGTAALVEVEVRARPAAGAASVTVHGSVAMTLAGGSKPVRATGVRLVAEHSFKVGTAMMTIGEVKVEEESTKVTLNLARSVMSTIREVRFLDAKSGPIESRRTSSGYFNEKAQMEFDAKTKDKVVTVEFELWQNLRVVKVPFNVEAGLGVAAGLRPSGTAEAPAAAKPAAAPKPDGPPPAITKGDGADSVETVVKQLQSAALASRGAQVLAVIHPTDRGTYGQGIAMALAFLPMATMDNEKATEQTQKELDALFAKHKITPPFMREPEELFKGVDLPAFVSDALTFIKGKAKKGDKPADMLPVPQGRPENVSITGDSATATLGGKEVKFARISGRWFIRLE